MLAGIRLINQVKFGTSQFSITCDSKILFTIFKRKMADPFVIPIENIKVDFQTFLAPDKNKRLIFFRAFWNWEDLFFG